MIEHVFSTQHDIVVKISNDPLVLPQRIRNRIDDHWKQKTSYNDQLYNGVIYSINNISLGEDSVTIDLGKSDYAHYVYTLDGKCENDLSCRAVAVGALIKTSDNKLALGKMANHTSFPNVIQCPGGCIEFEDSHLGIIDPLRTLRRELLEEIGIDIDGIEVAKPYIIVRKNLSYIGLCYVIQLTETSQQLYDTFLRLTQKGKSELSDIIYIENDRNSVRKFCSSTDYCKVDYLEDLLLSDCGINVCNEFTLLLREEI